MSAKSDAAQAELDRLKETKGKIPKQDKITNERLQGEIDEQKKILIREDYLAATDEYAAAAGEQVGIRREAGADLVAGLEDVGRKAGAAATQAGMRGIAEVGAAAEKKDIRSLAGVTAKERERLATQQAGLEADIGGRQLEAEFQTSIEAGELGQAAAAAKAEAAIAKTEADTIQADAAEKQNLQSMAEKAYKDATGFFDVDEEQASKNVAKLAATYPVGSWQYNQLMEESQKMLHRDKNAFLGFA